MADAPLLRVEDLTRRYEMLATPSAPARNLDVLKGVDFTINSGEMISIVGQSGTGKSTLLHILGTLDKPTAGRVEYRGTDVFAMSEASLASFRNENIGFVFQFHHLMAEFTALQNVMLPCLINGLGQRVASKRAAPLLEQVGLGKRLHHRPGELSGGEQQRVAFARALVMQPDIVFADEPTGNLDTGTSEEIHELLVRLNAETNTAFVVVTHNVRLAWLMKRHLLLEGGLIRELRDDEAPEGFLPQRDDGRGVNPS